MESVDISTFSPSSSHHWRSFLFDAASESSLEIVHELKDTTIVLNFSTIGVNWQDGALQEELMMNHINVYNMDSAK